MNNSVLSRSIGSLLGEGTRLPPENATEKRPRLHLWQTPKRFHCPIIGTCLSVADLERAVRKAGVHCSKRPEDIDLHHAAVHKASEDCRLSRILHKLLEKRFERLIHRSADCSTSKELLGMWQNAMRDGELPGAFWAIVTHPAADDTLLDKLHGDVHMLSHLNGASHRTELAQLQILQKENQGLKRSLKRSRVRSNEGIGQRDARIRQLENTVNKLKSQVLDDIGTRFLSEQVNEARRSASRAELRAERAETRLADRERKLDEYARDLTALRELLDETRAELALTERRLQDVLRAPSANTQAHPVQLDGRRVVYIGGRPSLAPHMRSLVERMDGSFVHHDGGLEDNRAKLEEIVQSADLVFCPVDCVSHDACLRAKSCCRRKGADFLPLRSSGISSFAVGLEKAVRCTFSGALPGSDLKPHAD